MGEILIKILELIRALFEEDGAVNYITIGTLVIVCLAIFKVIKDGEGNEEENTKKIWIAVGTVVWILMMVMCTNE